MDTTDPGIRKEQFDALYTSYARIYERFVENGFKTTSALFIILGWLLSAESARTYLARHRGLTIFCSVLLIGAAIEVGVTFTRLRNLSGSLRTKLDQLNYMHPKFYTQHHIPLSIYMWVIGQNVFICGLILCILL